MCYSTSTAVHEEIATLYSIIEEKQKKQAKITSCSDVALLTADLATATAEKVMVFYLDSQNNLLFEETIEGDVDHCTVYPRRVLEKVIEVDAISVILSHNHPGGSRNFSPSDKKITRRLYVALASIGCELVDHVLVYGSGNLSMRASYDWETISKSF